MPNTPQDLIEACPFQVTEVMLAHLARVFPDRAPEPWMDHPQQDRLAGKAEVTRWLAAVHAFQSMPKDSIGNPIEPETIEGEGLITDLDRL